MSLDKPNTSSRKYMEFMHFDGLQMSQNFSKEKSKIEIFHNKEWI